MISHEYRDTSDRLLPSTAFLLCTRAHGFRPAWFHSRKNGAIGGSVVSRRSGPASAGRAATRRGYLALTLGRSCLLGNRSQNAVSLHSRLCLWRPVTPQVTPPPLQVGLRGARGIEIASPVSRERDGLPRSETPSFGTAPLFVRSSSPCVSCDAARVVHPSLASRFACARARQEMIDTEVCNLNSDARARTDVRARCPFPAPACRPVRVERSCPCERPTRESHVICAAVRDMPCGMPDISLRVISRFETAQALASSPPRPCHGASAPSFPGALRTSTEPVTIPHRPARFRVL